MIEKIEAILKERFGRASVWQEDGRDYYSCNIPYQAFIGYVAKNNIPIRDAIPRNLQYQGGASCMDYIDTTDKEHVLFFIVLDVLEASE